MSDRTTEEKRAERARELAAEMAASRARILPLVSTAELRAELARRDADVQRALRATS